MTVAELVADARHAGSLEGAALAGEARGDGRLHVRIGLWLDARGRIARARFRATTCATLIAYAEAACRLAEGGGVSPSPRAVLGAVRGVHPLHLGRAALVASAFARATRRVAPAPGAHA